MLKYRWYLFCQTESKREADRDDHYAADRCHGSSSALRDPRARIEETTASFFLHFFSSSSRSRHLDASLCARYDIILRSLSRSMCNECPLRLCAAGSQDVFARKRLDRTPGRDWMLRIFSEEFRRLLYPRESERERWYNYAISRLFPFLWFGAKLPCGMKNLTSGLCRFY